MYSALNVLFFVIILPNTLFHNGIINQQNVISSETFNGVFK